MSGPALVLASGSARRRQLLEEAGIAHRCATPAIDDGVLVARGVGAVAWTMAMAFLKARWVTEHLEPRNGAQTVLGADTVCTIDGEILGQPADADHARRMLRRLNGATHQTITGVCLIDLASGARVLFADATRVNVGALASEQIETYLAGGNWRGKAGAYNLTERVADGWPVRWEGDPATVMGLPMERLRAILRETGA